MESGVSVESEQLFDAVGADDLNKVRSILTTHKEIYLGVIDRDGNTILHRAANCASNEVIKFLIENYNSVLHIDQVNEGGDSVLHRAALAGELETMKLIYNAYPDNYYARNNSSETVDFILKDRWPELVDAWEKIRHQIDLSIEEKNIKVIAYLQSVKFGRQFRDVQFTIKSGLILYTSALQAPAAVQNSTTYKVVPEQITSYEEMIRLDETKFDFEYFHKKNDQVIESLKQFCDIRMKSFSIIVLNGYILAIASGSNINVLYSKFRTLIPEFNRSAYFLCQCIDPDAPTTTREEIIMI